jgi:hypothetical protein
VRVAAGARGGHPVEDIDLLVLGEPDRDQLYAGTDAIQPSIGRPVQIAIRDVDWLTNGEGSFHDTVVVRPMVPIPLDGSRRSTHLQSTQRGVRPLQERGRRRSCATARTWIASDVTRYAR